MTISLKKNKSLLIGALVFAALLCAAVIRPRSGDVAAVKMKGLVTGDLRVELLENLGFRVEENRYDYDEVTIPSEFDEVYSAYNELQKNDGFDLEKYKGKTVNRFSYLAKQFPGFENEKVYVNLLIYKGRLIGGDVCTARADGFMTGLLKGAEMLK